MAAPDGYELGGYDENGEEYYRPIIPRPPQYGSQGQVTADVQPPVHRMARAWAVQETNADTAAGTAGQPRRPRKGPIGTDNGGYVQTDREAREVLGE